MDEDTDPISAGLDAAVCFEKDFLGAEAVEAARQAGVRHRRVAWSMAPGASASRDAQVAKGDRLLDPAGRCIGVVTSAAFSPSVGTWLGQGRAETGLLGAGSVFAIETAAGDRHHAMVAEAF